MSISTCRNYIRKLKRGCEKTVLPFGYYTWKPPDSSRHFSVNFGDELFVRIVSKLLGRPIVSCRLDYRGRKVLVGGSTIGLASNDDLIWGAGVRDGVLPSKLARLRVLAVRGPMSADLLRARGISVPDRFGDPAILTPHLFPEWGRQEKKWELGIVPHFSHLDEVLASPRPENSVVISPMQCSEEVIGKIASCERVIASSLHGIICAEVYGIPTASFRTNNQEAEPDFKYEDYFAATGRSWTPARNFIEAERAEFGTSPDVSYAASELVKVFPSRRGIIEVVKCTNDST